MMATPTIVDFTTKDTGGSESTHTVDTPTHSNGDELFVAIAIDRDNTLTLTGWTAVYSNIDIRTGDVSATFALYHKTAGASEPATITITSSVSERSVMIAWSMSGYTGIDGTTGTDEGESTTATCPTLTSTEANTRAFLIVATDAESLPHSLPSTYTNLAAVQRTSGATLSIRHKELITAQATGSQSTTITTTQEWIGATMIIAGTPETGGSVQLVNRESPIKTLINGGLIA